MQIKKQMRYLMIMMAAAAGAAGCSRSGDSSNVEAIRDCDSLPGVVKELVTAVADNDAEGFARIVAYPLQRPYPLHDIDNAVEMRGYYSTLVDDSLRNVLTRSKPESWSLNGWRGWTVGDGAHVWVDSLVYDMPYVSKREHTALERLRKQEISSLNPVLQGDWEPVTALSGGDGSMLRIDARRGKNQETPCALRLLVYNKGTSLSGLPDKHLSGAAESEGSELSTSYVFTDDSGERYIFDTEPTDGEPPTFVIESPDGHSRSETMQRVYWLDLLKR